MKDRSPNLRIFINFLIISAVIFSANIGTANAVLPNGIPLPASEIEGFASTANTNKEVTLLLAPTDINLSKQTINENSGVGALVGTFSTTDPEDNSPYSYALVAGDGSTENSSFTISGDQLITAENFDYEFKSSYSIRVRSTDSTAEFYEEVFIITVINVNEEPTDISMSSQEVAENSPLGTTVGSFTTIDPDTGNTFTYELLHGPGYNTNTFTIVGDELRTSKDIDFEVTQSYKVLVQSTDNGGLSTQKEFTISIIDENEQPTDITISGGTVSEAAAPGTSVASFDTVDPDGGESFTYTLVPGTGLDTTTFEFDNNILRTVTSLNYESSPSYAIRVRSTDSGGNFIEEDFSITVTDVNENPTDITLNKSDIDENSGAGTPVGIFSTDDPDAGETFSYTLVEGLGSGDNASFSITSDQLIAQENFNYEGQNSFSIRVRSTDSVGNFIEKTFTISVNDVNEAPSDITLSKTNIDENSGIGALVGNFSTNDPDTGESFSYTLVAGDGGNNNASFTILDNQLFTAENFDYEIKSSYSIRVRSTDSGNNSFEKAFLITINDLNDSISDISLSNNTIDENSGPDALVGTFSTTDPDGGAPYTYELVIGEGSDDNASFSIKTTVTGIKELRTTQDFNYESKSSYSIRVRSTDSGDNSVEKSFTITVNDINEKPTNISLIPSTINENSGVGATVGTFSTTDQDTGESFTYALVTGTGSTDNSSFTISGNQLLTAQDFNFENKSSYSIRVRSTDQGGTGLSFEKAITVTINDVNEPPVAQDDEFQIYYRGTILPTDENNILNNDSDVDEDLINTAVLVTPPTHAKQFIWYGNGTFEYQPNDSFLGVDSFTYEITDGEFVDNGTVEINVLDPSTPSVSWKLPVVSGRFTAYYQDVLLEVTAQDDIGIEKVWFYRYDADQDKYFTIGYDYTAPYQATLDASVLNPNVDNQISAIAYDANNSSPQASIFIKFIPHHITFLPVVSR